MTPLQLPPRLILKVSTAEEWEGQWVLVPAAVASEPGPGSPGKQVGELLLVSGDPPALQISLGTQDKLTTANLRKAGTAAARWLVEHKAAQVGLNAADLDGLGIERGLEAFCEGLVLGAFRFSRYKLEDKSAFLTEVSLLTAVEGAALLDRVDRVSSVAKAVNLAREWSHEPPNIINPHTLAQRAQALAVETGLKCTLFGERELSELGAGAILSVGLGSKTPSQMILLAHPGHGSQAGAQPVVVVGKAITFDTGGYSLKPTQSMVGMKFDKCGGMAVLGIMKAVAALNLSIPVVGIVAAAENMISGHAYRPNDIITSLSGKTIEIISTDAEGRMVLSDVLTYASTQLNPRAIIDLATLTGGVVTALGKIRAGLMSTDDDLAGALAAAGERSDDRLWRLPLDEEYFDLIKGSDSDLKNSAGVPQASPIVGGIFLKQFVLNQVPWAHIDIAGTATLEAKGTRHATGFGVRLVLDYLQSLT
ncbi:MAG: leucyl aminopeptidase family protein [Anaerolineales bacterium]|nr:leucyl aminopeptidase family protein [Anaerolineales bacterium]